MEKEEFRLLAASFYLCNNENCTLQEQLDYIDSIEDEYSDPMDDNEIVIVLDIYQYINVKNLLEYIETLADNFEKVYNQGYLSGVKSN